GVEASDEITMPRPAAVGRREARATDVLSGNEGLLGPPSAGQPHATVHHRVHQTRQDPILALAEDTGGSQDDDLEILGRPKQPLLFEELHAFEGMRRLDRGLLVDAREMFGPVTAGGRNMDETAHPRRPRRATDPPKNRGRGFP